MKAVRHASTIPRHAPLSDRLINWASLYSPLSYLQMGTRAAGRAVESAAEGIRSAERPVKLCMRVLLGPVNRAQMGAAAVRRFLHRRRAAWHRRRTMALMERIEAEAEARASADPTAPVIAHFSVTARTETITFCGLAMQLASWGLRLGGVRVANFVCTGGQGRCMGGHPSRLLEEPPCTGCRAISDRWFREGLRADFSATMRPAPDTDRPLEEVLQVQHGGLPLGQLILPSLQWSLRRLNLVDDAATRRLAAHYLASARALIEPFEAFLDRVKPRAVLVFNGVFYAEATVRAIALARGIPVYSYEYGHLPNTLYFSDELACEVAMRVPDDFRMTPDRDARMDRYLADRFAGGATMGSVRFFQEVRSLDPALIAKARSYRRVVSVFTNVAFDTSHINANYLFPSMIAWAETVAEEAARHPDVLFVIRAHPGEARRQKPTAEPVVDWLAAKGLLDANNIHVIRPDEFANSYELVGLSDLVLVYNSTVGVEALISGRPMLNAGLPKYRFEPFFRRLDDIGAYLEQLRADLESPPTVDAETQARARRFMYYLYFETSLDFAPFLKHVTGASWLLRDDLQARDFDPAHCEETAILRRGLLGEGGLYYS